MEGSWRGREPEEMGLKGRGGNGNRKAREGSGRGGKLEWSGAGRENKWKDMENIFKGTEGQGELDGS